MHDNNDTQKLPYWLWLGAFITVFGGFVSLLFGFLSLIHNLSVGVVPLIVAGFFITLFGIIMVTWRVARHDK